jgi:hypothetical protein
MLYRLFDLELESEIELPDLERVATGTPTLVIERSKTAIRVPGTLAWSSVRRRGDASRTRSEIAWSFAWQGEDLLLAIPECGNLLLEHGFRTLACSPYPKATDLALGTELTHNVIPRIFGESGHLVVHASSVIVDGVGCLVFMGPSGAGKSTLAASFAGEGADLVSDDCVLLRSTESGLVAFVTGAYARLWDDSIQTLVGSNHDGSLFARTRGGSKWSHRFAANKPAAGSHRVEAIFYLEASASPDEGGDVRISEAPRAELLSALTNGTLLLDPYRKENRSRRFAGAGNVAEACPAFYRASYPRKFARLAQVRRAILKTVARTRGSDRLGMAS